MGWVYNTGSILHLVGNAVDDWGIPILDNYKEIKCKIRELDELKPIINNLGNEIIPNINITINGATDIKAGDTIKYLGNTYTVITSSIKRDLAGKPLFSKVVA